MRAHIIELDELKNDTISDITTSPENLLYGPCPEQIIPLPSVQSSFCRWLKPRTIQNVSNHAHARDQLSNDRTYLAWLRMSFVLVGVAFTLLHSLKPGNRKGVVLSILVLSMVFIIVASIRYFRNFDLFLNEKYEENQYFTHSLNIIVILATIATFILLLTL